MEDQVSPKKGSSGTSKKKTGIESDLTNQQKKDVQEVFNLFDHKSTGFIDARDLEIAMTAALGFEPKKEEIKKIIAEIDKDSSGYVSYDDFLRLMVSKINEKDENTDVDYDNTEKTPSKNVKHVPSEPGSTKTVLHTKHEVPLCRQNLGDRPHQVIWPSASSSGPINDLTSFSTMRIGGDSNLNKAELSGSVSSSQIEDQMDKFYLLHIVDFVNKKKYEASFPGSKSILEVKLDFFRVTAIPVRCQQWVGWPDAASTDENIKIGELDLKGPLVLVLSCGETKIAENMVISRKQKLIKFFSSLIALINEQPITMAKSVRNLIQRLIDGVIEAEEFTEKLKQFSHAVPPVQFIPFLKETVPLLIHALMTKEISLDGINCPSFTSMSIKHPVFTNSQYSSLRTQGSSTKSLMPSLPHSPAEYGETQDLKVDGNENDGKVDGNENDGKVDGNENGGKVEGDDNDGKQEEVAEVGEKQLVLEKYEMNEGKAQENLKNVPVICVHQRLIEDYEMRNLLCKDCKKIIFKSLRFREVHAESHDEVIKTPAGQKLYEYCVKLNAPRCIMDRSESIIKIIKDEKLLRGRSTDVIVATAMCAAYIDVGIPRNYTEISSVLKVRKKDLSRCMKVLMQHLGIDHGIPPSEFMCRYAQSLNLPDSVISHGIDLCQRIEEQGIAMNCKPESIAVAIIYLISEEIKTVKEISKVAMISETTIKRIVKILKDNGL